MIIDQRNYKQFDIGKKAGNLFLLEEKGYLVPPLFCVDTEVDCREKEEEIKIYIDEHFPNTEKFSVRSSASIEDGSNFSFAGQFDTYLNVKKEEIITYVNQVFASLKKENVLKYCTENDMNVKKSSVNVEKTCMNVKNIRMNVIIQEMIDADCSGVLFTANPQGLLNETVIVLGKGTGENVVEDKVDTTTYYYNQTDRIYYYEKNSDSPLLSEKQVEEIVCTTQRVREILRSDVAKRASETSDVGVDTQWNANCHPEYGTEHEAEYDIEFAIKDGKFYLLQARPITTLPDEGTPIILDNSNIVESYPGITLPLTQSFIREVYYKVFRSLLIRLTKEEKTVDGMDDILRNMVDVANGRVYYRISNWYDVILLLPFSSRIIPIWQEMMGVQNKAVSSAPGRTPGFLTRLNTMMSFFSLLLTNPRKMDELDAYFSDVLKTFESLDTQNADNGTLLEYYRTLEKRVTDQWDITLVNDMYSFIFTGLLKSRLKKHGGADYEVLTKRYISQIAELESLKPIKELIALSGLAGEGGYLPELAKLHTNEDYERFMGEKEDPFRNAIRSYIYLYGDRNIEELKLESKTFRTDPILLVKRILQYAKEDVVILPEVEELEPLTGVSRFIANRAALGIRNREKSRLNRSRLYGMMRLLMLRVGENLCAEGKLEEKEDIFWLYMEEIEQISECKKQIDRRKLEYEMYERLPAYTRLVFAGKVMDKNPKNVCGMSFEKKDSEAGKGEFHGVACSGGIAEGEVLIVEKPTVQIDTRDKILVTKMTDPGWVFLIADAKGIIAEKGSLLSHTAIISRELGKPAVVGVEHITKLLKNGDYVRVDGDKGEVVILGHERSRKKYER